MLYIYTQKYIYKSPKISQLTIYYCLIIFIARNNYKYTDKSKSNLRFWLMQIFYIKSKIVIQSLNGLAYNTVS